jgi:magnesium chelatase family protein
VTSSAEPVVGRARSAAVVGLAALEVNVEVSMSAGLPAFTVIGTLGSAARQAADRVRAALTATGVRLPARKILASFAPADVPTAGASFDLPLAVAVLVRLGVLPEAVADDSAFLGEVGLDGAVRPVSAVLPAARCLADAGVRRLFVSGANATEAALIKDLDVVPVAAVAEMIAVCTGVQAPSPVPAPSPRMPTARPDLADVRGQVEARRALEVAAAGGHHVLLLGPPGCGKSMLAARLPGLLPPLDDRQALELAAVRSVAGLLAGTTQAALDRDPPLRRPHHATTAAALLGGGSGVALPGEISLASHGVLFLDELFEWPRRLLDALREPVEEGVVRIARARATVTYPAVFQLVCAANPCPCGGGGVCDCTDADVWAYRRRLSGPLADRIDLAPRLAPLHTDDLVGVPAGESSATVAHRVAAARAMSWTRWGRCNARAGPAVVRATATRAALQTLGRAVESGILSGRGFDRALRVSRTCADLAACETIGRDHVLEALAHRSGLREAGRHVGPGPQPNADRGPATRSGRRP